MPDFEYTASDSILPYICLSQEGIFTAILNLNKKKAIDPDNIPSEFLLRYAECCSRFLYLLFNKSLTEGHIPREWKCAKIVPIHKSCVKSAASNYRPVSLLCATGKILGHIVAKHISSFAEKNNIFFKHQHGFRRGLSTMTQLVKVTHFFLRCLIGKDKLMQCS